MIRAHHEAHALRREIAVITVSARRAWAVSEVSENGKRMVELRSLDRHANGTFSTSRHRSVFRPEHVPQLIAALEQISAGDAR